VKDAELCKSGPSCRPIVQDGTGLSGTRCPYSVQRLRWLLPGYRAAGKTRVLEECGTVARWSLPPRLLHDARRGGPAGAQGPRKCRRARGEPMTGESRQPECYQIRDVRVESCMSTSTTRSSHTAMISSSRCAATAKPTTSSEEEE
jgi:hypothetical protein